MKRKVHWIFSKSEPTACGIKWCILGGVPVEWNKTKVTCRNCLRVMKARKK